MGFELADYDRRQPLVIDPVLKYSTLLGGSSDEYGRSIAVDTSGNAYVTGYTLSTNFPITTGVVQTTWASGWDAFVAKLNPSGTALVYSTYLGGSGDDYGRTASGSAAFTLTVTGTNFVSGATVQWNGSARSTTVASSTQLTAAITAADTATPGVVDVTVVNPAPGGGASAAFKFAVDGATDGGSGSVIAVAAQSTTLDVQAGGSTLTPVTFSGNTANVSNIVATCLDLPTGATCSYDSTTQQVTIQTGLSGAGHLYHHADNQTGEPPAISRAVVGTGDTAVWPAMDGRSAQESLAADAARSPGPLARTAVAGLRWQSLERHKHYDEYHHRPVFRGHQSDIHDDQAECPLTRGDRLVLIPCARIRGPGKTIFRLPGWRTGLPFPPYSPADIGKCNSR